MRAVRVIVAQSINKLLDKLIIKFPKSFLF